MSIMKSPVNPYGQPMIVSAKMARDDLPDELRHFVEHEVVTRGGSDELFGAWARLDDIDGIEILFALEDRYDLEFDDRLLDAADRGLEEFTKAIIDALVAKRSRTE